MNLLPLLFVVFFVVAVEENHMNGDVGRTQHFHRVFTEWSACLSQGRNCISTVKYNGIARIHLAILTVCTISLLTRVGRVGRGVDMQVMKPWSVNIAV